VWKPLKIANCRRLSFNVNKVKSASDLEKISNNAHFQDVSSHTLKIPYLQEVVEVELQPSYCCEYDIALKQL